MSNRMEHEVQQIRRNKNKKVELISFLPFDSDVLSEITQRFSLGGNISAQFYKLLYYREGDFFLRHIDR